MTDHHLVHSWNWTYVLLSYVIASTAAFVALQIAGRVGHASSRSRAWLLVIQGALLGFGIWSMHFIGMLALDLGVPVGYDLFMTAVSGLAAALFLIGALFVLNAGRAGLGRLVLSGVIAGFGICVMHYLGMAAMRLPATTSYATVPFALSVLIAVSASIVALFLFSRLQDQWRGALPRGVMLALKTAAALVMGVAIVGMHYTGMAAVDFQALGKVTTVTGGSNTALLATLVIFLTVGVLGSAGLGLILDLDDHDARSVQRA